MAYIWQYRYSKKTLGKIAAWIYIYTHTLPKKKVSNTFPSIDHNMSIKVLTLRKNFLLLYFFLRSFWSSHVYNSFNVKIHKMWKLNKHYSIPFAICFFNGICENSCYPPPFVAFVTKDPSIPLWYILIPRATWHRVQVRCFWDCTSASSFSFCTIIQCAISY